MTDFLARRGLVLRSDLLGVWAGWLTPVFEPRRYRTWFFVAALPGGAADPRRVDRVRPGDLDAGAGGACGAVDAGEMLMMPPTYLTCLEVARHADPADVLAAARAASVDDVHARGGR